jgi:hypothetical protein
MIPLAQVDLSQIPKEFTPPYWLVAVIVLMAAAIVTAAIAALYYCNWSFRQFVNRMWQHIESVTKERDIAAEQAHERFAESLKTIVDGHTASQAGVVVSVEKLATRIDQQGHVIGEIHRAVVKTRPSS